MGNLKIVKKKKKGGGEFTFFFSVKNSKTLGVPSFCTKKKIKSFGNSHAFFYPCDQKRALFLFIHLFIFFFEIPMKNVGKFFGGFLCLDSLWGVQLNFWNLLTECMLDYGHCQVNWFMLSLLRTTDQNDRSTKPMAYHNSEQVYEPRLEPVSSGY